MSKDPADVTGMSANHGARVFALPNGKAIVKQTVKSGPDQNDPYVIDAQRERHVDLNDDAAVADAVRSALNGQL